MEVRVTGRAVEQAVSISFLVCGIVLLFLIRVHGHKLLVVENCSF